MKPELQPVPCPGGFRKLRPGQKTALLAAFLALTGGLISCVTSRVVLVPPSIPGATYVGSEACVDCHEDITRDFPTAAHARLQAKGENAQEMGCESCHGPASLHSESGGEAGTIINPEHSPEVCFSCHLDKRGEFNLPYHHPLEEGKVSCSSCHNPHKGSGHRGGGVDLLAANETCYQCHDAQRGPHVFEHEATREGCVTCHNPHGSVNQKLLTERNSTLCLKCHFQQQGAGAFTIGGVPHATFVPRGTCWSAGCHEAVHGSQVSSSLRF